LAQEFPSLCDPTRPVHLYPKMGDDEGKEPEGNYILVKETGEDTNNSWGHTGKGRVTYPNGDQFEGMFENGVRNGKGTYKYWEYGKPPNEQLEFEGAFKENLKTGLGMMKYRGGAFYHGHFLEGKRHGEGTFKYANGDIYSGMWENGKKHGKGTYVYSTTKYQIVGDWKNGEIVSGKWALTNGAHYIGGFKKQKPFGDGVWKFPNQTCVEGAYTQQIAPIDDGEPDKSGAPAVETKVFWKTAAVITTEE